MSLQKLDVYNVRNIVNASINPAPVFNFIYGDNASGKSSLLEAIFILGRARSFRTAYIKQVVNHNQDKLIVSGKSLLKNGSNCQLGIQFEGKDFEIRINQLSNQPRHQLAYSLPIQIIDPKSYRLLDSGPQARREFIDWGVFNDNDNFLLFWRQYKKALNQRNALLKNKHPEHIEVWNKELLNYGTIVTELRQTYINRLDSVFKGIIREFIGFDSIKLIFLDGWDRDKGLLKSLQEDLPKDLRYGYTHSGPHRSDLQVLVDNRLAKDFVSRGQLKLLVLALKLAQVKLLTLDHNNSGCILIDDFTAELDSINRFKLLTYLSNLGFQVFLTATQLAEFGDIKKYNNYKVFHVEQGNVKQM